MMMGSIKVRTCLLYTSNYLATAAEGMGGTVKEAHDLMKTAKLYDTCLLYTSRASCLLWEMSISR